jgi:acetyl-CoA C-acetyltransferase
VAEDAWEGVGTVESWTTPVSRDGVAEKVFLAVRTPADSRALAVVTDASEAEASTREDIAGVKVRVATDGTATLL